MTARENKQTERGIKMSDTKQYYEQRTGFVYDLIFKGETLSILKGVSDGREIVVDIENLENTYHFMPYTKQMQKQVKKKQDLSTLDTVSSTIKKCLEDNYVICHSRIDRMDDLITVSIVMGKEV